MSAPSTDQAGIRQVIRALRAAGYTLTGGHDGEDFFEVAQDATEESLIEHLTACDDSTLHTRKEGEEQVTSHVYFVLGNDPEEVVCDYGVSLEPVLGPLTEGWWELMAIQPSPYAEGDPSQIRFEDREGDSAWFNLYGSVGSRTEPPTIVVTMPYDDGHDDLGTRYRQIELSASDRLALLRHLTPELPDLLRGVVDGIRDESADETPLALLADALGHEYDDVVPPHDDLDDEPQPFEVIASGSATLNDDGTVSVDIRA